MGDPGSIWVTLPGSVWATPGGSASPTPVAQYRVAADSTWPLDLDTPALCRRQREGLGASDLAPRDVSRRSGHRRRRPRAGTRAPAARRHAPLTEARRTVGRS